MTDHFTMTREEAAELMLGEEPWPKCNRCHGTGGYVTTTINSFKKTEQRKVECTLCRGRGCLQNHSYFYACRVLGLPTPDACATVKKEKLLGQHKRR